MKWYLVLFKYCAAFNTYARRKKYWMFALFSFIFNILSTDSFSQDFWSINDTTKEALIVIVDRTKGGFVKEVVKGDYTTNNNFKFFKFEKPLISETLNTKFMITGIYPDLKNIEKIVSEIRIGDSLRSVPVGGSYTIAGEEMSYVCFLGKGTPDAGFYILDGVWKNINSTIETKMFTISKNSSDTISLKAKKPLIIALGCILQVKDPKKEVIITVNSEGVLGIVGEKEMNMYP